MSGEESYLPLAEIGRRLQQACEDLESGAISVAQMDELLADIRSLEQRVIVLQYKAMERIARGESSNGADVPAHGTLSFSFGPPEDLMPAEAQEAEVPLELRNQISLIDSIEELSAEEQAEIRRLRKLRAEEEKKKQVALPLEEEPVEAEMEQAESAPTRTESENVEPEVEAEEESIASGIKEPIRLSGIKKMPRIKIKPLDDVKEEQASEIPAEDSSAQESEALKTEVKSKDTVNEPKKADNQYDEVKGGEIKNTSKAGMASSPAPEKVMESPLDAPMTAGQSVDKKGSINEEIKKTKKATLAQKLGGRPIESIAKSLSVNVRLGVVKTLFKGEADIAAAFIETLDNAGDLSKAETAFSEEAKTREWKETSAPYKKLVELISRRYSS